MSVLRVLSSSNGVGSGKDNKVRSKPGAASVCVSIPSLFHQKREKNAETSRQLLKLINLIRDKKAPLQPIHSRFLHPLISSALRCPEVPGQPCQWSAQSPLPPVGQWRLRLCLAAPEERKGGWCRIFFFS